MVYIFAGHHNKDSGAIGNGFKESDLTKIVRDMICFRIKELQPNILIDKDDDDDTLSQLIAKIKPKMNSDDIILDIHYNSGPPTATGVECLVSNNAGQKSKDIAKDICDITTKITGLKNRGVKKESDSARGKLGILNLKGSAVIWEVGFISNINDLNAINKDLHWICDEVSRILIKYNN